MRFAAKDAQKEKKKYFVPYLDYTPDSYLDYPFDDTTLVSEIAQFAEKKNEVDPRALEGWLKALDEMFVEVHEKAQVDGWRRLNPEPKLALLESLTYSNCVDVYLAWEPFIILSTTTGTSGGWLKRLFPSLAAFSQDTKRDVFDLLGKAVDGGLRQDGKVLCGIDSVFTFMDALRSSWLQLKHGHFGSMLVHVFPKDEPVKEKKLLEARHRSIQMPDWTYVIIERLLCCWVSPDGVLSNHDFVYSQYGRFSDSPVGGWVFGTDLDSFLSGRGVRSSFDLDVSGWDKSLPFAVVLSVYRNTLFSGGGKAREGFVRVAETMAKGCHGKGIFSCNAGLFRLPEGSSAWSSGVINTLCGNSMAHSALLRSLGVDHIVMGDDANACIDWKGARDSFNLRFGASLPEEKLVEAYAAVGLRLKKVGKVCGLSFCKRTVSLKGKLGIDWDEVLVKSYAKQSGQFEKRIKCLYPFFRHYRDVYQVPPPSCLELDWDDPVEIT